MTDKQKKALTLAGFIVFIAFMALVTWFVGRPIVTFAKEPEKFRDWVEGYGAWGQLMFLGMMILQTVVAFIPGEPMEIVAGYAFGAFSGTVLCILGEAVGSVMVFLFVRRFGIRMVEVFYPREKIDQLKFLQNEKKLKTFVFFVFLMPGTPKDILGYCVGLTRMKLSEWVFISLVARFPSVVTSTVGGDALGVGKHWFAVIVFALTILISLSGYVIYNKTVAVRAKRQALREERRQNRKSLKRDRRGRKRESLKKRIGGYKRKAAKIRERKNSA
ncbi:MAG: VTT domain-containing protein [Clostridia bacterium]|nr:VTT domain-containing protein [Clostridia bacterium]